MTFENLLLGVSVHLLFYEHLPHWGGWFNWTLQRLPKPLQALYEQWCCPYCAGFWIGLALHALTGQWFLPAFSDLPDWFGQFGTPVGWFMDGLAFALMTKLGVLFVNAIGYPALLGYAEKQAFFAEKSQTSEA